MEQSTFKKDSRTGVVINTDKANYLGRRAKKFAQKKLEEDMKNFRGEIDEIKQTQNKILELLEALNGN